MILYVLIEYNYLKDIKKQAICPGISPNWTLAIHDENGESISFILSQVVYSIWIALSIQSGRVHGCVIESCLAMKAKFYLLLWHF